VYFFGNGHADGTREMKRVLGGKGANLAEMTNLGVPVPPGFTIACEVCVTYLKTGTYPPSLRDEVARNIARLSAIHKTRSSCRCARALRRRCRG
jgi:pyruvate,orthophosphate dikinase